MMATKTTTLHFRRPGERAWVRVEAAATQATVIVNDREMGSHLGPWTPFEVEITDALQEDNTVKVCCIDADHPTKGWLRTQGFSWVGARGVTIRKEPTKIRPAARQRSSTRGTKLLVDGKPFQVRGILHWGYYPELKCPWPDENQIRREIGELQSMGFNLIKFCLWIPPEPYYQLCDEMGMLVWQEYPIWDEALVTDPTLRSSFEEFFELDGPYPCVILRTLTCENDRVDQKAAQELRKLAHEKIPGSLILDNSSWVSNECEGDFHDEHPYLHNAQWKYFGARMRDLPLKKPLLLGETMCVDCLPDGEGKKTAIAIRRFQIETLTQDLPDAGYVICSLRDLTNAPLGLYTTTGSPKFEPSDWSWHGDNMSPPRVIQEPSGPIIGPRKGQWKCPEYTWWSPLVRVLDSDLPRDLIESECVFDLLSGRVLSHTEGTRVLVEVVDVHDKSASKVRRHPLVIEFMTEGKRQVVSAFRHDTEVGKKLLTIFKERTGTAPEIGPIRGSSTVLRDWQMSTSGNDDDWMSVVCDTPLVNRGRNVFEGWAKFRSRFRDPGGKKTLRCEAVGDFFEVWIDGNRIGQAGNRTGTWDGTRDVPREFLLELTPGDHHIEFLVRDWRAAGGMVGPVFLSENLEERIF